MQNLDDIKLKTCKLVGGTSGLLRAGGQLSVGAAVAVFRAARTRRLRPPAGGALGQRAAPLRDGRAPRARALVPRVSHARRANLRIVSTLNI